MRTPKLIVLFVAVQTLIMVVLASLLASNLVRASDATTAPNVPHLISYQGVLTDSDGKPLSASKSIETTIFDAETGGTAKWTEVHASVPVSNGAFSLLLGSVTSLPDALFSQPDRWLELKVDGVTLTPRQQLTSVPYALRSETASNADRLGGKTVGDLATEVWSLDSISSYVDPDTGKLGVMNIFCTGYTATCPGPRPQTEDDIQPFRPLNATKSLSE